MDIKVVTLISKSLDTVEKEVNTYCDKEQVNAISISVVPDGNKVYIYLLVDRQQIISG